MLIETEPCKDCDFTPEICSCDIDICQITRGKSRPISQEQYEASKTRRYEIMESDIRDYESERWEMMEKERRNAENVIIISGL